MTREEAIRVLRNEEHENALDIPVSLYERMLYYIMETYDLRRSDAEKCMKAAFDTAKELSKEATWECENSVLPDVWKEVKDDK